MAVFRHQVFLFFFFFNDTATTEIYTLSLHDALPISACRCTMIRWLSANGSTVSAPRSEEHTSELQSRRDLVCRLLLEKKKTKHITESHTHIIHWPIDISRVPYWR